MTTLRLKPNRGGFLRPFGCGWFILKLLLGHGPGGSPTIDPNVGTPQSDIFYHYKMAIINATASERATSYEERHAQRGKRPINPENIEKLTEIYMARSPWKMQHKLTLPIEFNFAILRARV